MKKVYDDRAAMGRGDVNVDWGMGEHMAFASLVASGYPVRLSGEDCGRGTFTHRHAVIHDQNREKWDDGAYQPLQNIDPKQAPFIVIDKSVEIPQQQFIAKTAIRSVRSANVPKADQIDMEGRAPGTPAFDPYAVLKVPREASPDEIRQAYHRMAKLYHPDRIASFELPDEVMDYVRAMLVRINLAFEQIGG